jgi:hypothetical protein
VLVNTAAALVALVALPAEVAVPDKLPTNVVAVILALAKLAVMPVLITAAELPAVLRVVNVGYTVVEAELTLCVNAVALVAVVAVVAEVAVPLRAPTNVVAVILAFAKLAVMPVLITAAELPAVLKVVNVGYTVVDAELTLCVNAVAFVAVVAEVAAPLKLPTKVVAVMLFAAMLAKMPVTFSSATFPLAEL